MSPDLHKNSDFTTLNSNSAAVLSDKSDNLSASKYSLTYYNNLNTNNDFVKSNNNKENGVDLNASKPPTLPTPTSSTTSINSNCPSPSISSDNHMSIVSLNDDDIDSSSVADSDSDTEDIPAAVDFVQPNIGFRALNGTVIKDNSVDLVQHRDTAKQTSIGSIAVQNSSDITFGNKTFYQGPVTIKQFLLEKDHWVQRENGTDNPCYVPTDENDPVHIPSKSE